MRTWVVGCGLWVVLGLVVSAEDFPKVFYSKSFPGSVPAYSEIILDRSGHGEYREAAGEDNPVRFQLTEKECGEVYALVEKLDRFQRPLASNLKVANTGIKTFRFDDGKVKHEVKFNYSEDPDARAMWDWFERIAETEQHFINLERAARFDKLGVNQALLLLETCKDRKRLVAADQFLPLLDRIAKNESYLHMARERAAKLADAFRAEKQGPPQ